jgi:hypothetical protein
MNSRQTQNKQEKERKRKARAALLAFLQRLRKACKVLQGIDTWQECMQELETLLQHYQADIPAAHLQRLRNAMQPTDTTRAGLGKACKVLQWELEQTIDILPTASHSAAGLLGGLVVVAVAIGALVIFLEQTAVEVVVVNDGCSPIAATGMPINLPGLHVPSQPIPSGGRAVARVPRISVEIDATQQGRVELVFLGFSVPVQIGQRVSDVRFDGSSVLGQRTSLRLGTRGQHELVVACR